MNRGLWGEGRQEVDRGVLHAMNTVTASAPLRIVPASSCAPPEGRKERPLSRRTEGGAEAPRGGASARGPAPCHLSLGRAAWAPARGSVPGAPRPPPEHLAPMPAPEGAGGVPVSQAGRPRPRLVPALAQGPPSGGTGCKHGLQSRCELGSNPSPAAYGLTCLCRDLLPAGGGTLGLAAPPRGSAGLRGLAGVGGSDRRPLGPSLPRPAPLRGRLRARLTWVLWGRSDLG